MRIPQVSLGPRLALLASMVSWLSLGLAIGYALGSGANTDAWVYVPLMLISWLIATFTTALTDMHMCVWWMEEFIRNERKKRRL